MVQAVREVQQQKEVMGVLILSSNKSMSGPCGQHGLNLCLAEGVYAHLSPESST